MAKKLQQGWQSFSDMVMPKNAPPVQVKEMRRAFYAGAGIMLNITKQLGDEEISEDAGVRALEGLEQEIKEFLALVGKKY